MNEHLSRLSILITENQNQLIGHWQVVVCKLPGAQRLDEPLLRDHMPQLLNELSSALTEAANISLLEMRAHRSAAEHGAIRFKLGFDVEQVIAEFGILRDIIQEFAEAHGVNISRDVNRTVNRVIDKAIAGSLQTYVRQQAGEVERKRQEYLSFIVHDLKTPISAIAAATYLIDQNLESGREPSIIRNMVDIVDRNTTRLNNRVMEIINEESRLQALTGETPALQLQLRDVDLWPLVERVKNDCQSIADSRQDTIRNQVPFDLRIYADPQLFVELLQNLLSNALKYTSNGEIVVGGTQTPDSVVCWVRDTGVGIAPEQVNRIFEARHGDPNVPGSTGLGLAIVHKVVQLHGGTLSVESKPGSGSTFRMTFPKALSEHSSEPK